MLPDKALELQASALAGALPPTKGRERVVFPPFFSLSLPGTRTQNGPATKANAVPHKVLLTHFLKMPDVGPFTCGGSVPRQSQP